MIVTQRSREIALLRAVGATRRQVLKNLLGEALLLGVGASAVGVVLGIGVAKGLNALMAFHGLQPAEHLDAARATHHLGLADRRHPGHPGGGSGAGPSGDEGAAGRGLREATPGSRPPSKKRLVIGVLTLAGGVAAVVDALYGDGSPKLLGLGVPTALIGVITLAPVAARPMAAAIGWPLRLRGVPGDLGAAERDAQPASHCVHRDGPHDRPHPGRQHGCLLGVLEGVVLGPAQQLGERGPLPHPGQQWRRGLQSRGNQGRGGCPWRTGRVGPRLGSGTVRRYGHDVQLARPGYRQGDDGPRAVRRLVGEPDRRRRAGGEEDGQGVQPDGRLHGAGRVRLHRQARPEGGGIFDQTGGFVDASYLLSLDGQDALAGAHLDTSALVLLDKGADIGRCRTGSETALADHPDAKILTQEEYEKEAAGFIDQLLNFVTVMLLLAVFIALLGIVNTLALSVYERTRELGLLRAVGMTRSQVRQMVRWESVVISLIGAGHRSIARHRPRRGAGAGAQGRGHQGGVGPVPDHHPVRRGGRGGRCGCGGRPGRSASRVDVLKAVVTD
jgi:putative ABC transport system permease protein